MFHVEQAQAVWQECPRGTTLAWPACFSEVSGGCSPAGVRRGGRRPDSARTVRCLTSSELGPPNQNTRPARLQQSSQLRSRASRRPSRAKDSIRSARPCRSGLVCSASNLVFATSTLREPERSNHFPEKRALPLLRLHQDQSQLRSADLQRNSRRTAAGAEVNEPARSDR